MDSWDLQKGKAGGLSHEKCQQTGGDSPNRDDGGFLGQSWVCLALPSLLGALGRDFTSLSLRRVGR